MIGEEECMLELLAGYTAALPNLVSVKGLLFFCSYPSFAVTSVKEVLSRAFQSLKDTVATRQGELRQTLGRSKSTRPSSVSSRKRAHSTAFVDAIDKENTEKMSAEAPGVVSVVIFSLRSKILMPAQHGECVVGKSRGGGGNITRRPLATIVSLS